ncbi:MAG: hypothetical protein JW798_13560 [Prolixibacteraceae bacterium]|nr:hypothetical protein [Prolixibacteraceae bacterium]
MKILKILMFVFLTGMLLLAGSFFYTKQQIKRSLIEIGTAAAEKYDCTTREALVLQLQDNSISVKTMNSTIWAIGKLKITESIPAMEKLYDVADDVNHKYNKSRYEIEKALGYMKYGKTDLMSFENLEFKR